MSSTTGIQNLLVNVVRPVYVYAATGTPSRYTVAINLSNVDTFSGNVVSVLRADISAPTSNLYVGTGSGRLLASVSGGTAFSVAVGVNAGSEMCNVVNSVYLGFNAGAGATNASNVIAIGANAIGNGSNSIVIGSASGGTGSSNIIIGNGIATSTTSNLLNIGNLIYGNFVTRWVGIGTPNPINDFSNKFDVSGNAHISGSLGIQRSPGGRTLDVNGNFRASDGFGTLDFSNGVTSSSNGFASLQGTNATVGGVRTIGTLKRGIVMVSAVDTVTSSNYAARTFMANTASNAVDLASNIASGDTSITLSGSNIQISDSVGNSTFNWSITYLPLP